VPCVSIADRNKDRETEVRGGEEGGGRTYVVCHEDEHEEERDEDGGAVDRGAEHTGWGWDGDAVRVYSVVER
jgi:hypothetical protein